MQPYDFRQPRLFALMLAFTCFAANSWGETAIQLQQVGRWFKFNHTFYDVETAGNYLYFATEPHAWHVLDVNNPSAPRRIQTNTTSVPIVGLKASGSLLIISEERGAEVYDLSNPASPQWLFWSPTSRVPYSPFSGDAEIHDGWILQPTWYGIHALSPAAARSIGPPNFVFELHSAGGYLYSSEIGGTRLLIMEMQQSQFGSSRLEIVGQVTAFARSIRASGQTMLLAGNGLTLYDLTDPVRPAFQSTVLQGKSLHALELSGEYAYAAEGTNAIHVVRWNDPLKPKVVCSYQTPGDPMDLCVSGDYIYVADGTNGIVILKQTEVQLPSLTIENPPTNQVLRAGETLRLSVSATSTLPMTYQWSKDGPIAGATESSLVISDVNRSHEGAYTVTVSNGDETVQSQANVRVMGGLLLDVSSAQSGHTIRAQDPAGPVDPASIQLQVSTNLVDWEPRSVTFVPGATSIQALLDSLPEHPRQFYRILELP